MIQAKLIGAGLIGLLAFGAGWQVNGWRWESKQVAALEQAQRERDEWQAKVSAAERRVVEAEQKRRVEYRDRIVEIPKRIVGDCGLDAVGMQQLACAVRPSECTGKPDNPSR